MASVKVKIDLFRIRSDILDESTKQEIFTAIKSGVLEMTASGQSPVRGKKKFAAYAAQRLNDNTKYPKSKSIKESYPDKKTRPVNLRLTGAMLNAIKIIKSTGKSLTIGISGGVDALKAETHNEGTQSGRVPQRKFLPTSDGEEFTVSIQRKILAIIQKRVSDLFKRR